MADHNEHLSFLDAVPSINIRGEQEPLLADEEQQAESLDEDETPRPPDSHAALPVYTTIHK